MAMIEMEKVETQQTDGRETARFLLIIGLFLPTIFSTYTVPALVNYFVGAVGREAYSSVEMYKQMLTAGVLASCLWGGGMIFFLRHFKHLLVLDLLVAISIAIAGPDYVMFRFGGDIFQSCFINMGLSQTMSAYISRLTKGMEDLEITRYYNKVKFSATAGSLTGAIAAWVYCPFTIDQLLWMNVLVTVGAVMFQYLVVRYFKKIVGSVI